MHIKTGELNTYLSVVTMMEQIWLKDERWLMKMNQMLIQISTGHILIKHLTMIMTLHGGNEEIQDLIYILRCTVEVFPVIQEQIYQIG